MSTQTKKIWRLLEPGEGLKSGDQIWSEERLEWVSICNAPEPKTGGYPRRRRVEITAPHPFDEWFENSPVAPARRDDARYAWNAAIEAAIEQMDVVAPFSGLCELEELKK